MANIGAYHSLQQCANYNYNQNFSAVLHVQQPQIAQVGEGIPKKENGEEKYIDSMTPQQKATCIALITLATSILGSIAFITLATTVQNAYFYFGLIPTVVAATVSGGFAIHYYFCKIDLDSPKTRRQFTQSIRAHELSLSRINERFGGFGKVVAYQLMGNAPIESYRQAAHLCAQQAEADRIYGNLSGKIIDVYHATIAPAVNAVRCAQQAQHMGMVGTVMTPRPFNIFPAVGTLTAAYHGGYAQAELDNTIRYVRPIYKQAMQNLNAAYDAVVQPIRNAFRQLAMV